MRHQREAAKCKRSAMSAVFWPRGPVTVFSQISFLQLVTATHLLILSSVKIVLQQDGQYTHNATVARSRNHWCSGNEMMHFVFFSTLSHKWHDFRKKIEIKRVF
jgi:hypothetical protein